MAVSITIQTTLINSALEADFKDGVSTYTLTLLDGVNADVVAGKTITFDTASNGSIDLVSSVFFAIPSGKIVSKLKIERGATQILDYDLVNETFSSDGTYTVNNVIITFTTV